MTKAKQIDKLRMALLDIRTYCDALGRDPGLDPAERRTWRAVAAIAAAALQEPR